MTTRAEGMPSAALSPSQLAEGDSLRRRPQFSIAMLLLVTLVLGAGLACYRVMRQKHETLADKSWRRYYRSHVKRLENQSGERFLMVASAGTGQPLPKVLVSLTLIGPDGGDGGYQSFLTGSDGYARWSHPQPPGRYQFELMRMSGSAIRRSVWNPGDPYLVIKSDGSCQPPLLQMP